MATFRNRPLTMKLPVRGPAVRVALGGGAILALFLTPFASGFGEGGTIRGGTRNPGLDTGFSYRGETQIIAENSGYGTRQSNKGTGGGAIYGCRSGTPGNACLAAVNLNVGHAFSFSSKGLVGGVIELANNRGAPLVTNAKGVATGFNANFLEGRQAKDFLGAQQTAADSAKLAGKPATSYVTTDLLLFADVSGDGRLGAQRGATAITSSGNDVYAVTFVYNVSKCAYTASPVGGALANGQLGVAPDAANPDVVHVNAPSPLPAGGGFDLQVLC